MRPGTPVGRALSALGAAVVVAALFLKWYQVVRVGQVTPTSGFNIFLRLRWVILLAGALTIASALFDRDRWMLFARTLLGVILAALILRRVASPPTVANGVVNAEVGVYVVVAGAVAAALGGVVDTVRQVVANYPPAARLVVVGRGLITRSGPPRWAWPVLALGVALLADAGVAIWYAIGGFWTPALLCLAGLAATTSGVVGVKSHWPVRPSLTPIRLAAPFLIAFVVYFAALAIIKPAPTGDQPHYELESMSIAYDHDRNLANNYLDPMQFSIMFGRFVGNGEAAVYTKSGEDIFVENVGLPLLLSPGVPWVRLLQTEAPSQDRWPWNIEIILLAAVAAQLLYGILRRFRPDEPVMTAAVWACTMLCAPIVVYASQIYPEMPPLLLTVIAADCLMRRPSTATLVIGACAAGALPWVQVRYFPVDVLLALGLIARGMSQARAVDRRSAALIKPACLVLVPCVLSSVIMAIAFQHWYGSPWLTAPRRLPQFQVKETLSNSYVAGAELLWSSQVGLVPVAPFEILAIAAVPLFCRRYGRWALFGLLIALVYIAAIVITGQNDVFTFPSRYLIWLIPFTAFPLLYLVTEFKWARWIFGVLAAMTAYVMVSVVLHPPFDVTGNPATPVSQWVRLVDKFPGIAPPFSGTGYPDESVVLEWTLGLLALAVAIYVVGSIYRDRSGLRSRGSATV